MKTISQIKVSSESELRSAIASAGTETAIITLGGNIELKDGQLTVPSESNITLDGSGLYKIDAAGASRVIQVSAGATLTLLKITVTGGSSQGNGGGIYCVNGNLISDGGVIEGNKAGGNGGGIFFSSTNGGKSLTLRGETKISANTAGNGGGIYFGAGAKENIFMSDRAEISQNTSKRKGGGIYILRGALFMSGGDIKGNSADSGGGLCLDTTEAAVTLSQTAKISANNASGNGGGIFATAGNIQITGGVIGGSGANDANIAENGGGIAVGQDLNVTTIEISGGGKVIGNTARADGGGIYLLTYSTAVLRLSDNAALQENQAGRDGGGIYARGNNPYTEHQPEVSLAGKVTVEGNQAPNGDGGGIWLDYAHLGYLNVSDGVIFGKNKASKAYLMADKDKDLYNAHIRADKFSDNFEYGYNNYDIAYTSGTPFPESVKVSFECITHDKEGVYKYTMKEDAASDGWKADTREYQIVVTVSDDGKGNLIASVEYPDGYPSFSNVYQAKPVAVCLEANKKAVGGNFTAGQFKFGVYDKDGNRVSTGTNE